MQAQATTKMRNAAGATANSAPPRKHRPAPIGIPAAMLRTLSTGSTSLVIPHLISAHLWCHRFAHMPTAMLLIQLALSAQLAVSRHYPGGPSPSCLRVHKPHLRSVPAAQSGSPPQRRTKQRLTNPNTHAHRQAAYSYSLQYGRTSMFATMVAASYMPTVRGCTQMVPLLDSPGWILLSRPSRWKPAHE